MGELSPSPCSGSTGGALATRRPAPSTSGPWTSTAPTRCPPRQYPYHYAGPEGGGGVVFLALTRHADLVLRAKDAHMTAPPPGPTRLGLGVFWVRETPVATPTSSIQPFCCHHATSILDVYLVKNSRFWELFFSVRRYFFWD